MTTTPPPMLEPQGTYERRIDRWTTETTPAYDAEQIKARDAQWMERVTVLEADRKMLRDALDKLTHYAECQVAAFSSGRPSLDMTLFPHLCANARAALRNTHDHRTA